jgi:hypothetical protein
MSPVPASPRWPLGKLQHLDLAATDIGDEGLKRLSKLTRSRFLRLRETPARRRWSRHIARSLRSNIWTSAARGFRA